MGNAGSTNSDKANKKEFDNFYDIIDYIATYYILTMDFKSLSKLSEKEYCDKLVILTSDIINNHFNNAEVTYLAQRVKNGVDVNELSKEQVTYVNKDMLESLDVSNDAKKSIKKKRVCIGIAKFYVKIAHIFAAIVMTINPIYMYKDVNGNTVKTGLMEKDKIPKNVQKKLYKLNICDNRIHALKKNQYVDKATNQGFVQPKVCDMNIGKNGQLKTLADEPGITELMRLYLDDKYDYSTGTFTGMSESTKAQFIKDLNLFYTVFTGNQTMPPEITKFSDIKLRDYKNKMGCQGTSPYFKTKYALSSKDDLFVKYATNTTNMINTATNNQKKLLSVINDLFTFVVDPYTKKRKIRVNPTLTDDTLQKAVEKTRKLIIDLYVKCELDYVNGVKLYEAIVESKILETTQNQIDNLKKQANQLIIETTQPSAVKPTNISINPNLSNAPPPSTIPISTQSVMPPSTIPTYRQSVMPPSTIPTSSVMPSSSVMQPSTMPITMA